jgi:hypothetical protein
LYQRVKVDDHPLQTDPAMPPLQLANPIFEPGHGLIGDVSLWLWVVRDRQCSELL